MKVIQGYPQVSVKIEKVLKKILKGSVPVISTDMLTNLMTCATGWIILDCRELVEFEISHLPDAKWVGYSDYSMLRVSGMPKDANVAVYCSIGVRSENIAEKLLASGFTNVRNLYGGIFVWANERKKLVEQNQKSTLALHGYNQNWAKLLDRHVHCIQTK